MALDLNDKMKADPLMSLSACPSDELWDLYDLQPELDDTNLVPEGDKLDLDIVPQGSYPSPNYEAETVGNLDPYLSPRGEEMMDFSTTTSPSSDDSSAHKDADDLGLGSVSFDDLLDDDYGLPKLVEDPVKDDIDAEIEKYITNKSGTLEVDIESLFGSDSSVRDGDIKVVQLSSAEDSDDECTTLTQSGSTYNFRERPVKDNNNTLVVKGGTVLPTGNDRKSSNIVVVRQTVNQPKSTPVNVTRPMPAQQKSIVRPQMHARTKSPEYFPDDLSTDDKSRGAIQARVNRQKKKAYVGGLERQVSDLTKENRQLSTQTSQLKKTVDSLEQEVAYLRRVLSNDSVLAKMLEGLGGSPSLSLTKSFENDRKRKPADHDYGRPAKHGRRFEKPMSGGICLHVEQNNVSLEFCSKCARMARGASQLDVA